MLFQMGCTTTAVPIRNFGLAPPKPHFVAKGGGGGELSTTPEVLNYPINKCQKHIRTFSAVQKLW